jgi:hypothetical protein
MREHGSAANDASVNNVRARLSVGCALQQADRTREQLLAGTKPRGGQDKRAPCVGSPRLRPCMRSRSSHLQGVALPERMGGMGRAIRFTGSVRVDFSGLPISQIYAHPFTGFQIDMAKAWFRTARGNQCGGGLRGTVGPQTIQMNWRAARLRLAVCFPFA